jgi:chorismate mutase
MDDLKRLRSQVDEVDERILDFLKERVRICETIGYAKKSMQIPVKDPERELKVYALVRMKAAEKGLDPNKVESIYRQIVNMCSSVQE